MLYLRSVLYILILAVFTPPYALLMILCFPLPHRARRYTAVPWVHTTAWLIKHLLGIDYRVLGRENIPARPTVILSKHQSAWETVVLQEVFPLSLFVWKRELKWQLPFFGWALAVIPMISIDRSAGKNALNQLIEQGRMRLAQGYPIIIFPEGTRVRIGQHRRYKIGGAQLAVATGAMALPLVHNAGEFWGRNAFFKRPGVITVSIGPAIDPQGRNAEQVNALAETWMEAEMARISPSYYPDEGSQPATQPAA